MTEQMELLKLQIQNISLSDISSLPETRQHIVVNLIECLQDELKGVGVDLSDSNSYRKQL